MGTVVLVAALVPRLYNLGGNSLNSDEVLWMGRGKTMVERLDKGRFIAATKNLEHPGLIQAYLIGTFYNLLGRGDTPESPGLMDRVTAARLPIAVLGSLTCLLFFLLISRAWSLEIAFFSALFLALNPVHIALSRVAHVDSTLMTFFMLTVLTYFIGEVRRDWRWKTAAGVLFGLTLVCKLPAFLIPAIFLAWKLVAWLRSKDSVSGIINAGDVLCLELGYVIYILLHGRVWLDPPRQYWFESAQNFVIYDIVHACTTFLGRVPVAEALVCLFLAARWIAWRGEGGGLRGFLMPKNPVWGYLFAGLVAVLIFRLFAHPVENTCIFLRRLMGLGTTRTRAAVDAVGGRYEATDFFYVFLVAVRNPVFLVGSALAGLAICLWQFMVDRKRAATASLSVVTAFLFILAMSFSRRAMRYILPALPFICIVGSEGLSAVYDGLLRVLNAGRERVGRSFYCVCCTAVLFGLHVPAVIIYSPNYYLFHNSLIGGPAKAKEYSIVGWGEGYKEAVEFLKGVVVEGKANISVLGECGVLRYYWKYGKPPSQVTARIASRAFSEADYLMVILNKLQRHKHHPMATYADTHTPLHVVHLNGVDLATIHRHRREPAHGRQVFEASERILDSVVGRREWDPPGQRQMLALVGRTQRHREGWLVRGPYRTYVPGKYFAEFRIKVGRASTDDELAVLDVAEETGGAVLARRSLTLEDFPKTGTYRDFELPFEAEAVAPLEFRVYFSGKADVWFSSVTVRPIERKRD